MGCFLGCFGISSKRKRRRPAYRVLPGDHRFGSYEPLDSVSANLDDISGEPVSSDSELSKKHKEPLNYKIRKKVSFNLNVQTYEPIPAEEWESEEEEEETNEENNKRIVKEDQSSSLCEGDTMATKMASYPQNYRYRNCIDSYDEEDEMAYEDSDLDDEDEEDEDFDEDDCDARMTEEEILERFTSLSVDSQKRDSLTTLAEVKTINLKHPSEHPSDSKEGGLRSLGMTQNARNRSQYVHSVLNPVENLSQWKAIKKKGMPPEKRQRKENVQELQQQEIAVDASLSNWLVSPVDSYQSKTESISKSSSSAIDTISIKKGSPFGMTYSCRNREDMPILDITNLAHL